MRNLVQLCEDQGEKEAEELLRLVSLKMREIGRKRSGTRGQPEKILQLFKVTLVASKCRYYDA